MPQLSTRSFFESIYAGLLLGWLACPAWAVDGSASRILISRLRGRDFRNRRKLAEVSSTHTLRLLAFQSSGLAGKFNPSKAPSKAALVHPTVAKSLRMMLEVHTSSIHQRIPAATMSDSTRGRSSRWKPKQYLLSGAGSASVQVYYLPGPSKGGTDEGPTLKRRNIPCLYYLAAGTGMPLLGQQHVRTYPALAHLPSARIPASSNTKSMLTLRDVDKSLDLVARVRPLGQQRFLSTRATKGFEPTSQPNSKKMDGGNSIEVYLQFIKKCVEVGDHLGAEKWFKDAVQPNSNPRIDSYNIMLDIYAQAGNCPAAEKWFRIAITEGFEPDILSYTHMISACVNAGEHTEAGKWLTSALQSGVKPNITTFNVVANACARAGDYAAAEQLLLKAVQNGLKPDIISYNAVTYAYAKAGNQTGAEKWFAKVVESDIMPNMVSYNGVISVCADMSDFISAKKLLVEALRKGLDPDITSFNAVMKAFAKVGKPADAEIWLKNSVEFGLKPDIDSYNAMMIACAEMGDHAKAERWFAHAVQRGLEPDITSYNAMMNCYAKLGSQEGAGLWLIKLMDAGIEPSITNFNIVIKACALIGDHQNADMWLQIAMKAGIRPNIISYTAVMHAYAESQLKEEDRARQAKLLSQQMLQKGVRPDWAYLSAMSRAVGHSKCESICTELGIMAPA